MSKRFDSLSIEKVPLSLQVLRTIRSAILRGRYRAGERLREEDIAEELAVSRHAIRIALSTLEAEGLVEGDPYRGKMVAELYPEQLSYLLPMRALLECEAVERAIRNLMDEDVHQLRRLTHRLQDPEVDWQEHVEIDLQFHQMVWALAGDVRLQKLLGQVVYPFFAIRYRSADQLGNWIEQEREKQPSGHQLLIEAICRRDVQSAKKLMEQHVRSARVNRSQPQAAAEANPVKRSEVGS
jgi:DNA-binding GntR family transcriptional regulator